MCTFETHCSKQQRARLQGKGLSLLSEASDVFTGTSCFLARRLQTSLSFHYGISASRGKGTAGAKAQKRKTPQFSNLLEGWWRDKV